MPKLTHVLQDDPRRTLEVEWSVLFSDVRVRSGGEELLALKSRKALESGAKIILPDGSSLSVRRPPRSWPVVVEVLRNGYPVPGSPTHPLGKVLAGSDALRALALLAAILAFLRAQSVPLRVGEVIATIVSAAVYLSLAFLARRPRLWPLWAGLLLAFPSLYFVFSSSAREMVTGLQGASIVFCIQLVRAIRAYPEISRLDPNEAVAVFR